MIKKRRMSVVENGKWLPVIAVTLVLCEICNGHSFMTLPRGDFKSFDKAECRVGGPSHAPDDSCHGPCIQKSSWQYDGRYPITKYKRGEIVNIEWTRNNHRGGFIRLSLVPEVYRMNKTAHSLFAFRYACFDADKQECSYDTSRERRCGTDTWIQAVKVKIPTSLENGYYTLGWVWYGGLDWRMESLFSDYWSCSRVQIQGGPLSESYGPVFKPGKSLDYDPKKPTCMASVNATRICKREPCLGLPGVPTEPVKFAYGKKPDPILRSWTSKAAEDSDPAPEEPQPPIKEKPPSTLIPPRRSKKTSKKDVYVKKLLLIDVNTDEVITSRFSRTIHIPKSTTGLSFVAKIKGDAKSVKFYINDEFIRTERASPYTSFGDVQGMVYPWPKPIYDEDVAVKVTVSGADTQKREKIFEFRLMKDS